MGAAHARTENPNPCHRSILRLGLPWGSKLPKVGTISVLEVLFTYLDPLGIDDPSN